MVLDAAKRGAAITSRLLAFSRRGDLRAENVDAYTLLTDMAEVLTHTLGGSVVCVVDVRRGLPPCTPIGASLKPCWSTSLPMPATQCPRAAN